VASDLMTRWSMKPYVKQWAKPGVEEASWAPANYRLRL
jgi:hypothetical protein